MIKEERLILIPTAQFVVKEMDILILPGRTTASTDCGKKPHRVIDSRDAPKILVEISNQQ